MQWSDDAWASVGPVLDEALAAGVFPSLGAVSGLLELAEAWAVMVEGPG